MVNIKINKKKCTNCKKCIDICPMGVFGYENDEVVVKDPKKCILCKTCLIHCPEDAIEIEE